MENTSYMNPYYMSQPQPRQIYNQVGNPGPQTIPQAPPKFADFVQGDLGATIYPINYYGQQVYLIDADNEDIVYRKSRDANGKLSPLMKYRLVPIEENQKEEVNMNEYVKEKDILDIITEAVQNEVEKRLSQISFTPAPVKKGSEE